ncbi:hypothetical protein D3C75_992020 [compost metagenome]
MDIEQIQCQEGHSYLRRNNVRGSTTEEIQYQNHREQIRQYDGRRVLPASAAVEEDWTHKGIHSSAQIYTSREA